MTDEGTGRAEHPDATWGGDPACWLERVCEECGAFREDVAAPVCARCGTPFPGPARHGTPDSPTV
jgi:predicted amidophosphoribosyltransferase